MQTNTLKTITLDKWTDYYSLIGQKFNERHWIYRGQSDHNWNLTSSLQRLDTPHLGDIEKDLLKNYKNNLHLYCDAPLPEDTLSYLAHMQHHGTPTRLLDFTESPIIAAFFAYENIPKFITFDKTEFIAIWVINISWLKMETIKKLLNDNEFLLKLKNYSELDYELFAEQKNSKLDMKLDEEGEMLEKRFFELLEQNIIRFFGDFFIDSEHKSNIIYPIKPSMLTERFRKQRCIFLCSSNLDISFMETLKSYSNFSDNVFLLRLPKNEREKAFRHFCQHIISRENLFPGIDGFAQSLIDSIPIDGC